MSATENRVPKQLTPWKAGQSGNPAGRPKGARSKLSEQFLKDMLADFEQHGAATIAAVRQDKPDQYLKVVASILPKEIEAGEQFAGMVVSMLSDSALQEIANLGADED